MELVAAVDASANTANPNATELEPCPLPEQVAMQQPPEPLPDDALELVDSFDLACAISKEEVVDAGAMDDDAADASAVCVSSRPPLATPKPATRPGRWRMP